MKRLTLSIFLLVALGFAFMPTETIAANIITVTTVAHGNGSISPAWINQEVPAGYPLQITAYPDPSFKVTHLIVNNNLVDPNTGPYCFDSTIEISVVIHVYFGTDVATYSINATAGPNGNIAPPGITTYAEGDTACFQFFPDPGYEIDQIIVNSQPVTPIVNPYCFDSVHANHNIEVTFKEIPPEWTVTINYYFLDSNQDETSPTNIVYTTPGEGVHIYADKVPVPLNFTKLTSPYSTWDIYEIIVNSVSVYANYDGEDGFPPQPWYVTNEIDQDYFVDIIFMDFGTGIPYIEVPSLVVSPNPVSGVATITKDADVIFTHIEVLDIMGNAALYIASPGDTIDLSSLAIGSYIVRFHTEKGFAVRTIIKK